MIGRVGWQVENHIHYEDWNLQVLKSNREIIPNMLNSKLHVLVHDKLGSNKLNLKSQP